ncbi:hypothetical protein OF83DRAFT_1138190 [Amylostereum chailletii]|nr:hypothetical protein OF83DRAFT_1138190 [Amylostereum chailletii]
MAGTASCAVCSKSKDDLPSGSIHACSACHVTYYCGKSCQTAHWPTHKQECKRLRSKGAWYDRHRKCKDGSLHEGALELITWDCPKEGTGWGRCFLDEADDLKRKFEGKFGGSEEKFFAYWPQGFRWTCCGMGGDMRWGCDHHGTGKKPCTCDFCRMGKPLPDRIYYEQSPERMGLTLPRGPDPRSGSNPAMAAVAEMGRTMMGLDL